MKHMCIIAFLAFQMLPHAAHALSCAPPVMTEETMMAAAVIFEGTVTASEETDEQPASKGMGGKSGLYTFTVKSAWKGVKAGDSVTVLRNTYWGDGFSKDVDYLVVAHKNGEQLEAHLCGLSMQLDQAAKPLEFLKKHIKDKAE